MKIELPYDPAIALLDIYPKDRNIQIQSDASTLMFTAALSTIAKLWKKPKCPLTDKLIKKMWFIYTMVYYLAMRKNEIMPFAARWVELEGTMLMK